MKKGTMNKFCKKHFGTMWYHVVKENRELNIYFSKKEGSKRLMLEGGTGTVMKADGSKHRGGGMSLGDIIYNISLHRAEVNLIGGKLI